MKKNPIEVPPKKRGKKKLLEKKKKNLKKTKKKRERKMITQSMKAVPNKEKVSHTPREIDKF